MLDRLGRWIGLRDTEYCKVNIICCLWEGAFGWLFEYLDSCPGPPLADPTWLTLDPTWLTPDPTWPTRSCSFDPRLLLSECRGVPEPDASPWLLPTSWLSSCVADTAVSLWMCAWMGECSAVLYSALSGNLLGKRCINAVNWAPVGPNSRSKSCVAIYIMSYLFYIHLCLFVCCCLFLFCSFGYSERLKGWI